MPIINEFIDGLLPGNYALTKSMELTKIQSSGTLWYTKKFLVLYYYVFLSNDIMTSEYIEKVTNSFDLYIESLDENVRESAKDFFYPQDSVFNFKSDCFKSFSSFSAHKGFDTQAEMNEHYQNAKKLYFTLLMGSGGQTGIKKKLKEACQDVNFVYSKLNVNQILFEAVIDVCLEQANQANAITDNSIKYIISQNAIDDICRASELQEITETDVRAIINSCTTNGYRYHSIENDMVAFIRNERQILYYYGYFHSKTAGATDFEFSSLTPIGELALDANFYEFLAIWEHQKIKMISQPATADINNIPPTITNNEKFAISYRPYTDVLGHINRNGSLSLNDYKYIVSRKTHNISEEDWIEAETEILDNRDSIKNTITSFGRRRDVADEDGRKELLKYFLGARLDLPFDQLSNPLGVVEVEQGRWVTNNTEKLNFIYAQYSKAENYKILKYKELFERCEEDLRCRYVSEMRGVRAQIDSRVKIDWDLFNIRMDKFVLLTVIETIAGVINGMTSFAGNARVISEQLLPTVNEKFSNLLRKIGLRTVASRKSELQSVMSALISEDYSDFAIKQYAEETQIIARYREESAEDLRTKIVDISSEAATAVVEGRTRNTNLISLLKSYYMARFLENDLLKCECCAEETFITNAGEPYIEFHHLVPFNIAEGPDHYLNLFALCPNCHRKIHFLSVNDKQTEYANISNNNYLHISFVERLRMLKDEMVLRSYHLEYLLTENAITQEEYNTIAA